MYLNNQIYKPEYEMIGFDSVRVELDLSAKQQSVLRAKCMISDGAYRIGNFIHVNFNPVVRKYVYATIHISSILNGRNILLITPSKAQDAIDNASSLIGFDLSNTRLLGISITGNMRTSEIVRNYFPSLVAKYGRKLDDRYQHTRYINDPHGKEGEISRKCYDKLVETKEEESDGYLLRFEVEIRRRLRIHLKLPEHDFIKPILNDLTNPSFFGFAVLKWQRELKSSIKSVRLQK